MNSIKKNIQKTSGTRNKYKPGQLVTINNRVFRIAFIVSTIIAIDLISVFINYHQICI